MKIEVSIEKKHFFILLGVLLILGGGFIVYAFDASPLDWSHKPSIMGHSLNEIDWSNPILTNVLIGGNLGVGTTTPAARIDSNGIIRSSSGGFQFPDGTNQTTAASSGIVGAGEERGGYGDNLCTVYWGSASCAGNLINCANSIKRKTSQIYAAYVGIDGNTRYRWQYYYLCIA